MWINDVIDIFGEFFDRYCVEVPSPEKAQEFFTFNHEPSTSEWVDEWDQRARHWRLYKLGASVNLAALLMSLDLSSLGRCKKILSVGSGIGVYEVFLARLLEEAGYETEILCVDSSQGMCDRIQALAADARARNLRTVNAPATTLPCPDASIDLLICIDAIQWMIEWRAVVAEMRRVINPKGNSKLCFTVHDKPSGYMLNSRPVRLGDISLLRLTEELLKHGFTVQDPIPLHSNHEIAAQMLGNLLVAKFQPNRK
ncbi:MAG: class I SAM-dependent methyltransferase [Candidatus Doudnabacteria bacterium]|nr:class I SAM-dependent methyltransferase [Candidatus Doudnabacteria bacterium]